MKVKFIQNVNVRDQIHIKSGEIFMAFHNHDNKTLHIMMEDGSAVVAPLNEINGILEIIEED